MIADLGQLCLIVASMVCLVQAALGYWGAVDPAGPAARFARPAALAGSLLVVGAFACLLRSFYVNDFSVLYVAENSNSQLPTVYRLCAVWGGHEGSLLLWVLMLAGWQVAVRFGSRSLPDAVVDAVLATMGTVMFGFLAFMLGTSNPFERLSPAAAEGRDLNPLLQDPGMVIHPPMLYMGYVGFSVVFSFAVAALLTGRLDAAWARWVRPWTTAAWSFLTVGILLGSTWAYYVLGWGGWWFWDPVENASFMPWLVGTALIHSLAVTERRQAFKRWTVMLAILTFSLSLLGTFLVRSGVLTSVHAFASDPKRGIFILVFLSLVVGAALALYAWRSPTLGSGSGFAVTSREAALLSNNVLLVVGAATVLLGTLYPLVIDVLGLGKISVGPPYFESVFVPLMVPLAFLLGLATVARWGHAPLPSMAVRLRWSAAIAVVAVLLTGLVRGQLGIGTAGGLLMAAWIATTSLQAVAARARDASQGRWRALLRQPASFYGMTLAHLGLAVFIVGVTMVRGSEVERDVRLAPGEVVELGNYRFRFESVSPLAGPNYDAEIGRLTASRAGRTIATLRPEKRVYRAQQTPVTVAAIDTGLTRDLYVALGSPVDETPAGAGQGAWSVRIHIKPFVTWIWGGCLMMAFGGALTLVDRRYATQRTRTAAAPPKARGWEPA